VRPRTLGAGGGKKGAVESGKGLSCIPWEYTRKIKEEGEGGKKTIRKEKALSLAVRRSTRVCKNNQITVGNSEIGLILKRSGRSSSIGERKEVHG